MTTPPSSARFRITRRRFAFAALGGAAAALRVGSALAAPAPPPPMPRSAFPPWVAPHRLTFLRTGPDDKGRVLAELAPFSPLRVLASSQAHQYPIEDPFSHTRGWVEAAALGPVSAPGAPQSAHWWGRAVSAEGLVARAEPSTQAPVVARYSEADAIGIARWVQGEEVVWDDPAWGEVTQGLYVYGRSLRPIEIEAPPMPAITRPGPWIGINRTLQVMAAYEDNRLLFWVRTSTGRPGWETPLGEFPIAWRVPNATMDSRTLGANAARANYRIENIKFTQYFGGDGNAIHENWWKDPDTFGLPSSHGCAGLHPNDAIRFWKFGHVGMPVVVHA
ncbi:MAG: L,D-transpeptidase [Chloroflexota bacterium]|nr:MAG: L,D-transpeptidase [Chloroflexota bacterium]